MTLMDQFTDYLETVYPGLRITGTQLVETRRAFFAGSWAILSQIPPQARTPYQAELYREAEAFVQDVKNGIK